MASLESLFYEIDAIERRIQRRTFLKLVAFAAVTPRLELDLDDREFLRRMAHSLIPAEALATTGIDVVANIEHLLSRGSAEHRAKILRLLSWARRVAFLYGGEKVAIRSRGSRFVLVQKMGKALSSLCLVAFWGDERALRLIHSPAEVA